MTTFSAGPRGATVSRQRVSPRKLTGFLCIAGLGLAATPVLAAESWLACEGTVATATTKDGKTENTSAQATDIYAYNDANKALMKYSEKNKNLSPVFVTGYDDKAISWANAGGANAGSGAATWEGRIDRASLALKMTRTEKGEVMTWTQQCKPTPAK
ncbi:MAG: hypothetical protein K2P94_07105 [Rhodospirillaceae bacterium]|nr:hypothetical protein [Rhodospirillaceae bacterium]